MGKTGIRFSAFSARLRTASVSSVNRRSKLAAARDSALLPSARIPPELLHRIQPWVANERAACEWYLSYPIAELGNVTPKGLVETGRADLLFKYLDHIAEGGYA